MITIQSLTLIQNNKTIFKDFSLHIKAKERLVIQAESGRGKTTLLRLIAGLSVPNSGEIHIDGELATKDKNILLAPHQRNISMVFQDLALWSHMNVAENISYAHRINGASKTKQKEISQTMLKLVGLEGYESRNIDTLSGGEAQRVALARALATEPKIVLMDEPLSSLDSKRNAVLRKEIIRLQEKLGFTLVYVTHNEDEALEIGMRFLELNEED